MPLGVRITIMPARLLLFLLLLGTTSFAFGQQKAFKHVSVGLEALGYKGDLSSNYARFTDGFHLALQGSKEQRINGRIELMIGRVQGQNSNYVYEGDPSATPNRYFETSFFQFGYNLQVNLYRYKGARVFLSQGLSFFRFNPRNAEGESLLDDLDSRPSGESYSNTGFSFPTMLGVQYVLPQGWGAGFQMGWINPSSDNIDNISAWGNRSKSDNIVRYQFTALIPLAFEKEAAPASRN